MNKEERKKIVILVLFIIFISAIVVGLTYAFISANASNNSIQGSSCFDIVYGRGSRIDGELEAGSNMNSGVFTNVTIKMAPSCTTLGKGTLYLTTVTTGNNPSTIDFTDNALKYSVVVGSNVVASGKVDGTANQVIYDNFIVNTTEVTYKVYIWLDESLEADSSDDESFSGYIHASVVATSDINE